MRILFCTDTYPPQVNGVSVVTALSVQGLRARGWSCGVIAPRYPAGTPHIFEGTLIEDDYTAIPSLPLPVYPDIRLAAPARRTVREAIARFKPDIVHSETEFVIGRLGQSEALRVGIPVTSSYHTDFARYTVSYGVPWLQGPVRRYLTAFHQRARRTFTPSAPAANDLRSLGLRDVEVWGRGVDIALFHPEKRSLALRQLHSLGHAFTFLYVGRLAAEKGVELLLDAFGALERELPPGAVRLVVAGAGPSENALRARAPESVIFLGNLDRNKELPALYASADAFIFASTTETLGLVVLEAMASGTPVIAAPAGGVADHLRHEQNGLAYPAMDREQCTAAMRRLATDRALGLRLREGARSTALALSWERELDLLDRSYRELLSAPSAG